MLIGQTMPGRIGTKETPFRVKQLTLEQRPIHMTRDLLCQPEEDFRKAEIAFIMQIEIDGQILPRFGELLFQLEDIDVLPMRRWP